jgi:cobalt-zinc-cadmium efflux system protein
MMAGNHGNELSTHSGIAHAHRHGHGVPAGRLIGAASLNSGFAVVQVIVGLALGSVVVLADAAHQVVDAAGLVTALLATLLAGRPTSSTMSFGWGKSDALGGFVSGLLLMASVAWIVFESISRLFDPVDVDGGGVIAIGLVAIAVNGLSVIALSSSGHSSLSLRAARLHLLTDLAGSFVVVAAGIALAGTSWTWIDPVASLVLSAIVLRVTAGLVTSAAQELLDRVPAGISVEAVTDMLDQQPGVERVHHVHVRPLGQDRASVTAHVVVVGQPSLHDAQDHLDTLTSALQDHLGITHATLQLECHPCENDDC